MISLVDVVVQVGHPLSLVNLFEEGIKYAIGCNFLQQFKVKMVAQKGFKLVKGA